MTYKIACRARHITNRQTELGAFNYFSVLNHILVYQKSMVENYTWAIACDYIRNHHVKKNYICICRTQFYLVWYDLSLAWANRCKWNDDVICKYLSPRPLAVILRPETCVLCINVMGSYNWVKVVYFGFYHQIIIVTRFHCLKLSGQSASN